MSHELIDLEKEKSILRAVRKTLAQVVVDVTPDNSALKSPLKPQTIEDIRMCFGLVSAREREIMELMQRENKERPHFIDEISKPSNIVNFTTPSRLATSKNTSESSDKSEA